MFLGSRWKGAFTGIVFGAFCFGMLWFVLMLRVLLDVRMAMGCGYPLHLVILAQKEGGRFGLEGSCWTMNDSILGLIHGGL